MTSPELPGNKPWSPVRSRSARRYSRLLAEHHRGICRVYTVLPLKDRARLQVNGDWNTAPSPRTQAWVPEHPHQSLYRFTAPPRRPRARRAANTAAASGRSLAPSAPSPTRPSPSWRSPAASTALVQREVSFVVTPGDRQTEPPP